GLRRRRTARRRLRAAVTATAAFALATQHLHVARHDIGGIALDAVLAGVLVGAQRAFDIHLAALAQVLLSDFRQLAEHLDPVPFGALLLLAGLLVGPRFAGGHAQGAHGAAASGVAHVGVGAEVADE